VAAPLASRTGRGPRRRSRARVPALAGISRAAGDDGGRRSARSRDAARRPTAANSWPGCATCSARCRRARLLRLLRPARMGDGLPADARRGPPQRLAAALSRRTNSPGSSRPRPSRARISTRSASSPRRPGRSTACSPRARRAAARAARLPARQHGSLQVGVQTRALHAGGAHRRLLRTRARHPRGGHARQPYDLRQARLSRRSGSRPPRAAPNTRQHQRDFATRSEPLRLRLIALLERLLARAA
jgi:hypothetical protein